MMRPMKLAGNELLFGKDVMEHLLVMPMTRVSIVIGGSSVKKNGALEAVTSRLDSRKIPWNLIEGVSQEPHWHTVLEGGQAMMDFQPDWIIALGGGSVMDAAKAMWIVYEHPELKSLEEILTTKPFPKLRNKARMCCIPTTSGTASEVSRSIVISDDEAGMKHGLGNMEMMPDVALCAPEWTLSMPPHVTAETGMDALTHAIEAYVSLRANRVSDILAEAAIDDIFRYLVPAYEDGEQWEAREGMLVASMVAGMSFTNVSLGITHSMSHTLGGYFNLPHGLLNAVLLPYVIDFNSKDPTAKAKYDSLAKKHGQSSLSALVREMNRKMKIPAAIGALVPDAKTYEARILEMAKMSKADGCTKTNPIIPTEEEFVQLLKKVYGGVQ
uniref:iron-containing alcohol dehydrogenase n=1 Tax=Ndongobacter massiliensis TaxID=1871025 RepID=UPI000931C489|nr:iron-containing alcohol dehydrogenase [Ndongobacter massiliensis]